MLECFYLRTAAQTNSGPINKIKTGNISICILSAGGASVSPLSHDKSDQTNSSLISRITGSDKNIDNPGAAQPSGPTLSPGTRYQIKSGSLRSEKFYLGAWGLEMRAGGWGDNY